MLNIDLNCDMGEGFSSDEDLMPLISSVNIACGYHAGDAYIMEKTVTAALNFGVSIGAHPSFRDREHFGRINQLLPPEQVYELVAHQLNVLGNICSRLGTSMAHLKPHGALYNMAAADTQMASAICRAALDFDPDLIIYGLSGSRLPETAREMGLTACSEAFADRTYQEDGSLTPRWHENALLEDPDDCASQVLQMVTNRSVLAVTGLPVPIEAQSICIHGDNPHALEFARRIREVLLKAEIGIRPPLQNRSRFF